MGIAEDRRQLAELKALLAQAAPAEGAPPPGWEERRAAFDGFGQLCPPADHCEITVFDSGRLRGERLVPQRSSPGKTILYLHGGGYCIGSAAGYRHLVSRLSTHAGTHALALDYRLAPEHPFPAALEDALAAYEMLLSEGLHPSQVAIAGDSAGGGLALATAVAATRAGLPSPGCLLMISPWLDLGQRGASYEALAEADPILTREMLDGFAAAYAAGVAVDDPRLSPLRGPLSDLPPTLVQVGAAEILLSDSLAFAERAALMRQPVGLQVWSEMIHIWPFFLAQLSAGEEALRQAGAWIARELAPADHLTSAGATA